MSDVLSYCRFRLSVSSAQTSLPLPAAESSCSQVTTLKESQKLNASLLLARLLITRAPTWGRWGKVRLVCWCFFRFQSFGTLQSAAVRMCSVLQHLGTWEPDAFCQRKKSYSVSWRAIFLFTSLFYDFFWEARYEWPGIINKGEWKWILHLSEACILKKETCLKYLMFAYIVVLYFKFSLMRLILNNLILSLEYGGSLATVAEARWWKEHHPLQSVAVRHIVVLLLWL